MSTIAVVPARGGSKRIPGKNIRPFLGQPAIAYPLQAAMDSGLFSRVIVSTDAPEVAAVASNCGADVFDRSQELADDVTPVAAVCADVLHRLRSDSVLPERFCLVFATALFVTPDDLLAGHRMLDELGADRVVSAMQYPIHPFKALQQDGRFWTAVHPSELRKPTQAYPPHVAHIGVFCWARTEPFLKEPVFIGANTAVYVVPRERAIDIDTPEDWAWAERLASKSRLA